MVGIDLALTVVAVAGAAAEGYSAIEQHKASKKAAGVDTATAQYNANVDKAKANQIDIDTLQNIDTERKDNQAYLSRMTAGYAASGVLTTTGSPLKAMTTTAGVLEQRVQQQYIDSLTKQENLYADAGVGIAEGAAEADADRMQGDIALLNGGAQIAGTLGKYAGGFVGSSGGGPQVLDGPGVAGLSWGNFAGADAFDNGGGPNFFT